MRPESFFILLYKERGMTSAHALNRLKKLLHTDKAGYCGTLDPIAEGLLIVAVGKATRLIRFAQESDKCYSGSFEIGKISPSYDIETDVETVFENPDTSKIDWAKVEKEFIGKIVQKPPLFSAIKIKGKRAYEFARKGKSVEIPERTVNIYFLELKPIDKITVFFRVECSPGTYIRSLINDIGNKVGTGAVLTTLLRERVGDYSIENAVKLSLINDEAEISEKSIISIKEFISKIEFLEVDDEIYKLLTFGKIIKELPIYPLLKEGFTVIYHNNEPKMILEKKGDVCSYAGNLI